MRERFEFEGIVAVSDIMTLAVYSSQYIKERVKEPVENEQHFHLLPEMDLFMPYQLCLIVWFTGDPYKDEKREPGIIVEYFFTGIDLIR